MGCGQQILDDGGTLSVNDGTYYPDCLIDRVDTVQIVNVLWGVQLAYVLIDIRWLGL